MARKILKPVANLATGVVGSVVGGLLGGKKKSAPAEEPQTMPLPDDEKVRLARKRALAQQMARGGRSSTILTDADTLG